MQKDNIEIVDGLRGGACLIVIFAHILASDVQYGMYANGCGKIGVWCFLVLSGFLAMHSMERRITSMSQNEWITFLIEYYERKVIRLYPAYVMALLLGLVLGFISTFIELIKHLLCLAGIGHFWYMPVIIKFYLFLPIEYLFYQKLSKKRFIFFNIFIGSVYVVAFPFITYIENSISFKWYFPVFIIGIVTYIIYDCLKDKSTHIIFDILSIFTMSIMLVFTPVMRRLIWKVKPDSWLQNKYLLYGFLWGLLIVCISKSLYLGNLIRKSRCLVLISDYSYELYLFHYLLLYWLSKWISNTVLRGVFVLVGSVAISWLMVNCKEFIQLFRSRNKNAH